MSTCSRRKENLTIEDGTHMLPQNMWQTNLHYATIQNLLHASNYNTRKRVENAKEKKLKMKLELMGGGGGGGDGLFPLS